LCWGTGSFISDISCGCSDKALACGTSAVAWEAKKPEIELFTNLAGFIQQGIQSAVPGRSMMRAKNLDREVKRHGIFEQRQGSFGRVFNTWQRVFVRYDIYYVSIITLT